MNFVAIDFETANYLPDSACALGVVKVVDDMIVDKAVHLIKPPTKEFVFTYIHGLTWKDVAKEADFGKLVKGRIASLRGRISRCAQRRLRQKGSASMLRNLWDSYASTAISVHGTSRSKDMGHLSDEAFECL